MPCHWSPSASHPNKIRNFSNLVKKLTITQKSVKLKIKLLLIIIIINILLLKTLSAKNVTARLAESNLASKINELSKKVKAI